MKESRRHLVLVGGGHSHVQVLRAQRMRPFPDAALTVVVDRPIAVYSGMVPGFVAGEYTTAEVEIDVRPLARRAGARLVVAPVTAIDAVSRRIELSGRPPLAYDFASLNVGSTVAGLDVPGVRQHALATRPIADLVERIEAKLDAGARRLVVVGGGAAGVEMAFCLDARLRSMGRAPAITLLTDRERLLPERPPALSERVSAAAARRGIAVVCGAIATAVEADRVLLAGSEPLPSDLTVWVTGAAAWPWLARTGLPTDARGFVRVTDTLQVVEFPALFAAGDCAVLESWPEIPKAGVYAVREGATLVENLRATLEGRPLSAYPAQRDFLALLNLGDGTAIGTKWGRSIEGRWVHRLKDRIDRKFMQKFQVLDPRGAPEPAFEHGMPPMPAMEMVCGGCAAKVGADPLRRALARLPAPAPDPDVLLGLAAADDVAAWRQGAEVVVANVDAFTAFTDDPWLVGRVAAHNGLSDLYAKGARPRYALAIVAVPPEPSAEETLFQTLSGARRTLEDAGVALLGGHTIVAAQLMVGFCVLGSADGPMWTQAGLSPGDHLVLTRALGTGVLWHADMAGRATSRWMEAVVASMVRGNAAASAVARAFPISAATDVTGFGLAGHVLSMLAGNGVSARLALSSLPALPGALELLAAGERSTFHDQNRQALLSIRTERAPAGDPRLELLFDPQTAGGLLLGVPAARSAALADALREAGDEATVIGEVVPPDAEGAMIVVD